MQQKKIFPIDKNNFKIEDLDLNFEFISSNYSEQQTSFLDKNVITLKPLNMINVYLNLISNYNLKNVVEFGIFEGAFQIILPYMCSIDKMVSIDLRNESQEVIKILKEIKLQHRSKLYYNKNQSDTFSIPKIFSNEELNNNVDLIIDDASHLYHNSKRTFEITFPLLKNGGFYIIEDWNWAHNKTRPIAPDLNNQIPLTKLLFDIIMLQASEPTYITKVETLGPAQFLIQKGTAEFKYLNLDEQISSPKTLYFI